MFNDLKGDVTGYIDGTNNTDDDLKKLSGTVHHTASIYSNLENKTDETIMRMKWNNNLDYIHYSPFSDNSASSLKNRSSEGKRLAGEFFDDYIKYYSGENITLIGYSYGGDVALFMADELDKLLEGKVNINIVTFSTPIDNTTVCELMYRKNIIIDHYYVENDRTVCTAAWWNNEESNLFLMNGKSIANFYQTYIPDATLENISENYKLLNNKTKGPYESLHEDNLFNNNHGWAYYLSFIKSIVTKKR